MRIDQHRYRKWSLKHGYKHKEQETYIRYKRIEVDLENPEHLHDLHSELPLASENVDITASWLSKKQQELSGGKSMMCNYKLTPHFFTHYNYVCHARNLKYYVEHGLAIKKVHQVLYFSQSNWLERWIRFNTAKKAKATSDFEKDFYKLMNNAVFWKTNGRRQGGARSSSSLRRRTPTVSTQAAQPTKTQWISDTRISESLPKKHPSFY